VNAEAQAVPHESDPPFDKLQTNENPENVK
jgi:hypothetical protein